MFFLYLCDILSEVILFISVHCCVSICESALWVWWFPAIKVNTVCVSFKLKQPAAQGEDLHLCHARRQCFIIVLLKLNEDVEINFIGLFQYSI